VALGIDLGGRLALVTGSTQGIGQAIATRLAEAGAAVVVNGRDGSRVDAAVAQIRDAVPDATVRGVAADLADAESTGDLLAELPSVDILVNNLGIFEARPALEIDDTEWRRYFEVNVLVGIRLIRAYLPGMMDRGFGRIVSIASDSAVVTPVEMVHYGVEDRAAGGDPRVREGRQGDRCHRELGGGRPDPHGRGGGVRRAAGRLGPAVGRGAAHLHA